MLGCDGVGWGVMQLAGVLNVKRLELFKVELNTGT